MTLLNQFLKLFWDATLYTVLLELFKQLFNRCCLWLIIFYVALLLFASSLRSSHRMKIRFRFGTLKVQTTAQKTVTAFGVQWVPTALPLGDKPAGAYS
jgi:hypothetical protein